jgi:hypothetical protein
VRHMVGMLRSAQHDEVGLDEGSGPLIPHP